MFRTLTIFFLGAALILSALWGSFYLFHLYPVTYRDFEWWMIPMFLSVILADSIVLLIGYALLKVVAEKIKEDQNSIE